MIPENPSSSRITAGPEGAAIVEAILKKYGPPQEFEWDQREGRTLFWERGEGCVCGIFVQEPPG